MGPTCIWVCVFAHRAGASKGSVLDLRGDSSRDGADFRKLAEGKESPVGLIATLSWRFFFATQL